MIWNVRVAHTLVNAGHNVTLIRMQPFKYRDATTKIDPRVDQWVVDAMSPDFNYNKMQQENAAMAFKVGSVRKSLFHIFVFSQCPYSNDELREPKEVYKVHRYLR